jgi:hypothetical protein
MDVCPNCGEFAYLDVTEILIGTREISLDACCECNLAGWIDSIRTFSRRERAQWMFEATGLVVHDVSDSRQYPELDFALRSGDRRSQVGSIGDVQVQIAHDSRVVSLTEHRRW